MTEDTSAAWASARTSTSRSSRPPSSSSLIVWASRSVSGMALLYRVPRARLRPRTPVVIALVKGGEEAAHDVLADGLVRDLADRPTPFPYGDHGLGHRAMAARAPEGAESLVHDVAGGSHVADVPHGHVQLGVHDPGDDGPLRALDLQEQVGELRDQLRVSDGAEVDEDDAGDDPAAGNARREHVQRGVGQLRALDATQGAVIGVRVQE